MLLLGTQRINEVGHLEIGGCDAVQLAREWGTPLYVMDEAAIRQRCRAFLQAFGTRYPRIEVAYAGKAFLCAGMCRIVEQEGLNLDVASGGELFTALRAGFPPRRISLHGNNKSREELRMALEAGIGRIIVDNLHELDLLAQLASGQSEPVDIALRVAPGIDPHTHRLISTGQVDTKFGFDAGSCAALGAARRVTENPSLRLRGLHCHVGSSLRTGEAHCQAVAIMVDLLAAVRDQTGLELDELNIGGGLAVRSVEADAAPDLEQFASEVTTALELALEERGLSRPVLVQEPGRYLVGEAGTTLYTAGSSKTIPGVRTYLSVDGGLSDNPRPAMYDARYEALVADRAGAARDCLVTLAGKHCETDILIWDIPMSRPEPGDTIAVLSTGAYNYAMASNYNRFARPAMVLVHDGRADLLVERECYEDLVRKDRIPAHLE
jgi:diaminopimelate decarboxylase